MYGSQYGSCTVDGSYSIESNGNVLASTIAPNADYGSEEVNPFCITSSLSYDVGVSDILSPSGTVCGTSIDAQVEIFNNGSQNISSVDITYDFGGGPMSMTYNGSIPSGSSETVTLPNYVANAGAGQM